MKLTKYIAAAMALCALSAAAQESESNIGVYASTEFRNGYLSNGYLFADDPVLQSFAAVQFDSLEFSVWNSWNLDKSHYADPDASNEIDYELAYAMPRLWDHFDIRLAVATWEYPNSGDTFDDWVAKVGIAYVDEDLPFTPELNARFGLDGQQGCYGQAKISRDFLICKEDLDSKLNLGIYGLVGYASKSYRKVKGVDDDGFVDFEAGAKLTYALCDNVNVYASGTYSMLIDGDLRDAVKDGNAFMADGDTEHFIYCFGIDVAL